MGRYEIIFKPSVERDLRRLAHQLQDRVLSRIEALAIEPRPRGAVKISGAERLYRVRVGDYRIVYELNADEHRVVIYYVRHRSVAYRDS